MATDVWQLLQSAYNAAVRPHLPRKIGSYAGVPVRRPRLFDVTDSHPDYEMGLLRAIKSTVEPDDDVTIVGGGYGVSAVVAAREGAQVEVYEGSKEMAQWVAETAHLATAADSITLTNARVSTAGDVWGESDRTIPPTDLNVGDVLVVDAEGAEREILANLPEYPKRIIVEVHPDIERLDFEGVDVSQLADDLADAGYCIIDDRAESDTDDEIRVWTAIRVTDSPPDDVC